MYIPAHMRVRMYILYSRIQVMPMPYSRTLTLSQTDRGSKSHYKHKTFTHTHMPPHIHAHTHSHATHAHPHFYSSAVYVHCQLQQVGSAHMHTLTARVTTTEVGSKRYMQLRRDVQSTLNVQSYACKYVHTWSVYLTCYGIPVIF